MNIRDYLSAEEVRRFTERSNWRALGIVLANWSAIAFLLYLPWQWTNPFTILLAIVLLSGRQLGLAVIMHDCGHNTFFTSPRLNHFVGQWLAARPIFSDLDLFTSSHIEHHRKAGTDQDPDLANYRAYPVDGASFRRKAFRDLTGQTGFKFMAFNFTAAMGIFSQAKREGAKPYVGMLVAQGVLLGLVSLLAAPWLYLLWFGSLVTSYMLIIRIRQVAEHAAVPDLYDKDPRQHARTTLVGWAERVLIAPNFVNYHLEHHFMASVPCYRLAKLHRLLRQRGAYDDIHIYDGYREVLRHAVAA